MTRKDYELIAEALEGALPKYRLHDLPKDVWLDCVEAIADALWANNQRFDRGRFLIACGALNEAPPGTGE